MNRKILKLILLLSLIFSLTQPAYAVVRESKIPPDTILYKSIQTWRDKADHPWEVVFFKEIKGDNKPKINLRLVGFPDLFEFEHPHPLIIKVREDLIIKVPDIFKNDQEALSPNVGQYDFEPIMNQLESNNFWLLELPLKYDQSSQIKIPYFILEEWQKISQKSS